MAAGRDNIIYRENPETLKQLVQLATEKGAVEEKYRDASAKLDELAIKLGFTSEAVREFFKIVGEEEVPEDQLQVCLGEIATHYAGTRDQLAAEAG